MPQVQEPKLGPAEAVDPGLMDRTILSEHAYLVARGTRHIAETGTVAADAQEMLRASSVLESVAPEGAIAFVCPGPDERAVCGFAASSWALDLYRWAVNAEIPQAQRARILGLLHGYSGEAIRAYEERECGRLWSSTESPEPESS